jgi:chromate transporter
MYCCLCLWGHGSGYRRNYRCVVVLGRRSIVDTPTALFFLLTVGLFWKFKKLPAPLIVVGATVLGLVIYPLTHL